MHKETILGPCPLSAGAKQCMRCARAPSACGSSASSSPRARRPCRCATSWPTPLESAGPASSSRRSSACVEHRPRRARSTRSDAAVCEGGKSEGQAGKGQLVGLDPSLLLAHRASRALAFPLAFHWPLFLAFFSSLLLPLCCILFSLSLSLPAAFSSSLLLSFSLPCTLFSSLSFCILFPSSPSPSLCCIPFFSSPLLLPLSVAS